MQWRGRRWREESRGPGGHGGKERRGGWAILPSPAKPALSGFGRKGVEYVGRLSFLSFPRFHVFFLLSVSHPSPQGRSCFCPSDQMFLNSSHQTTSEERLSAAGTETSFRNWINILFSFFFSSFRFVTMSLLSFVSICIFLLPQSTFQVVVLHQRFLSQMLPRLWLEFFDPRNES